MLCLAFKHEDAYSLFVPCGLSFHPTFGSRGRHQQCHAGHCKQCCGRCTLLPGLVSGYSSSHASTFFRSDNIDFSVIDAGDALNEISSLWNQIAQNTTTTYSEYTSATSDSSSAGRKRRFSHFFSRATSNLQVGSKPSLSKFLSGGKRIDVHCSC